MKRIRVDMGRAIVIALLVATSAHAHPMPLLKAFARATPAAHSFELVGNGVYGATTSACYANPSQWSSIPPTFDGQQALTAPLVVGVYWPGAQPPAPRVHLLFADFVKDLFDGPYWNATMPQYVGAAHGVFLASVDLPSLLTLAPSTTVHSRYIGSELRAQQMAGVLPAPDPQGNTIYVVHFPPGVTITDDTYDYIDALGRPQTHLSFGSSCDQYCAYHDSYVSISPLVQFTFIVMPDYSQNNGCNGGCGYGTTFDVHTEVLSHELIETVTDPYGLGWRGSCQGNESEIMDVCQHWKFYVPRRTSTPGTPACPNSWAMSAAFSNAAWDPSNANGCVVTDAAQPGCTTGVVPERLAAELRLSAPQPNPTRQSTRLRYSLPFASFVRLSVVDVAGREVAVLDHRIAAPGAHDATWDGRDADGRRVGAGLYFVQLEAAGRTVSQRVVVDR